MATSMVNWLGPELERGLNGVIEWKRRESSSKDGSGQAQSSSPESEQKFEDDGSNLWVHFKYDIEEPRVVQVCKVSQLFSASTTYYLLTALVLERRTPFSVPCLRWLHNGASKILKRVRDLASKDRLLWKD
jgi:hypothetical protein